MISSQKKRTDHRLPTTDHCHETEMAGFEPACRERLCLSRTAVLPVHPQLPVKEGERFELSQVCGPAVFETAALPVERALHRSAGIRTRMKGFGDLQAASCLTLLRVLREGFEPPMVTRTRGFTDHCLSARPPQRTRVLFRRTVSCISHFYFGEERANKLSKNIKGERPNPRLETARSFMSLR